MKSASINHDNKCPVDISKVNEAVTLVTEAAKKASEAAQLLSEFAVENYSILGLALHAELASNLAEEASTLASAVRVLCKECKW